MAHLKLVKQTSSGLLLPVTPESGDFLYPAFNLCGGCA